MKPLMLGLERGSSIVVVSKKMVAVTVCKLGAGNEWFTRMLLMALELSRPKMQATNLWMPCAGCDRTEPCAMSFSR
jgi:hypothetical protein